MFREGSLGWGRGECKKCVWYAREKGREGQGSLASCRSKRRAMGMNSQ